MTTSTLRLIFHPFPDIFCISNNYTYLRWFLECTFCVIISQGGSARAAILSFWSATRNAALMNSPRLTVKFNSERQLSELIFTVNLGEFNFKIEHGISRNFGWRTRSSITQLCQDHQLSFFANAHLEN